MQLCIFACYLNLSFFGINMIIHLVEHFESGSGYASLAAVQVHD